MGAALAQRLCGVARVLARHIPPDTLRAGAVINQQRLGGLDVLLRGLTRRFGGFQEETAQHAIVELLAFKRLDTESIDDALGRFETLKATAGEVAGFDMGHGALAWMLLSSMHIPRPAWPLLLAPSGGTFPANADGFEQLMIAIRRQGHIAEHTHHGPTTLEEGSRRPGGTGNYYWDGDEGFGQQGSSSSFFGSSDASGHWFYGGASGSGSDGWPQQSHQNSYLADNSTPDWQEYYFDHDTGHTVCSNCSQYWYDEHDDDNDTDTEDEMDESQCTTEDLASYYGSLHGVTEQELRQDYLFAKRRFRRFTNKGPRRTRFPRRPSSSWGSSGGKGGKFGRSFKGKGTGKGHFAGFPLGPTSLAGGKGFGGKNKGRKGNPFGKDGLQMKCHSCGSGDHLIGQCPTNKGKGGGKSFYAGSSPESLQTHMDGPLQGLALQGQTQSLVSWFHDDKGAWKRRETPIIETHKTTTDETQQPPQTTSTQPDKQPLRQQNTQHFITYEHDNDNYDDVAEISEVDGMQFWAELLQSERAVVEDSYLEQSSSLMVDLNDRFGALNVEDSLQGLEMQEISSELRDEDNFAVEEDRPFVPSVRRAGVELFGISTPEAHSLDLNDSADNLDDDLSTIDEPHTTTAATTTTLLTTDDYRSHAAAVGAQLFLPWWKEGQSEEEIHQAYLVRTQMKGKTGEGLLVDPGSPDNLVGSGWSKRMAALNASVGMPAPTYKPHFLEVGGVGTGAQHANTKVTHTVACPTIGGPPRLGTFSAPEIDSDKVPALLGLRSLANMGAIMDMGRNRLIVPGPAGVRIDILPGATVYPLEPTHSGHLLLPCSEFGREPAKERITLMSEVTTTQAADQPAEPGGGTPPTPTPIPASAEPLVSQ